MIVRMCTNIAYLHTPMLKYKQIYTYTVQITFIFIDFRVCDFAFAFKTQNAPCVSRFKRVYYQTYFNLRFKRKRDVRLTL